MKLTTPKTDQWVLRDHTFLLLMLAQVGFVLGEQILTVAVTVSVLQAGDGATTVGVVLAAKGLASLCLLLVGGVWSDRLPRRLILFVMLVLDTLTALLPLLHPGSVWVLGAALFVMGAAESFIRPAFNALLKGTLTDHQRMSGRALVNIATRLGVIFGPVIGTLLAAGGLVFPFVAAGAAFAASALTFRSIAEPSWTPPRRSPMLAEAMSGLSESWRRPWLAALLLFSPVSLMFVIAPSQVLLPVLSRDSFGSYAVYGTALACYGAGGLIGNLTMIARPPSRPGTTAMWSMALYALVPLALLYAPSPGVLFACYVVAGFGVETYALNWDISMYREIPDDLIGRITSLAWLSSFGLMPFGQALTGPLTTLVGIHAVLLLAAGLAAAIPPCLLFVEGMAQMRGLRSR